MAVMNVGPPDAVDRKSEAMSEEPVDPSDPRGCLPTELVAELEELVSLAESVEPIVAAIAERYERLRCWDEAWPGDPNDPAMLDARVLSASGDDRVRALLTAMAARAEAALEGAHTPSIQLAAHGLSGFGLTSRDAALPPAPHPPQAT